MATYFGAEMLEADVKEVRKHMRAAKGKIMAAQRGIATALELIDASGKPGDFDAFDMAWAAEEAEYAASKLRQAAALTPSRPECADCGGYVQILPAKWTDGDVRCALCQAERNLAQRGGKCPDCGATDDLMPAYMGFDRELRGRQLCQECYAARQEATPAAMAQAALERAQAANGGAGKPKAAHMDVGALAADAALANADVGRA